MALEYRFQRDKARAVVFSLDVPATQALAARLGEAEATRRGGEGAPGGAAERRRLRGHARLLLEEVAADQALILDYALVADQTQHWVPAARRLAALKAVMDEPAAREALLTAQIRETVAEGTGLPNQSLRPRYDAELIERFVPRLTAAERERIETMLLEIARPLRPGERLAAGPAGRRAAVGLRRRPRPRVLPRAAAPLRRGSRSGSASTSSASPRPWASEPPASLNIDSRPHSSRFLPPASVGDASVASEKVKNGVGSGCSQSGGRTMLHVGVDEVGYGPLLGPLVVGVAAFRLTDHPEPGEANLLRRLRGLVVRRPKDAKACAARRLPVPVDDSKVIHRRFGLSGLARGVGLFASAMDARASGHAGGPARAVLRPRSGALRAQSPGTGGSTSPRCRATRGRGRSRTGSWAATSRRWTSRVWPLAAADFNQEVERTGNKATVLGLAAGAALLSVLDRHPGEDAEIVFDRQGGRLDYAGYLADLFPFAAITKRGGPGGRVALRGRPAVTASLRALRDASGRVLARGQLGIHGGEAHARAVHGAD